ncbi:hypothetical protein [Streptomyces sp. MAR25Y5]|uniref:hypothetical protein n=1 Tax=Streptomyces sp. MAR25Y5 TaxID=2962028 RepID=UPI0020B85CB8|nr:hypothetical protein [Streptomyces sp. MAR25Y5]MCP3769510.1 hypothetical protein [Streptomyces sp. MAR25Y5]
MTEPSYSDVQKAVRVEKFRIWFAWVAGGIGGLIICRVFRNMGTAYTVAQVLWLALGVLSFITAYRMTNALNRKATAARRQVLGDNLGDD